VNVAIGNAGSGQFVSYAVITVAVVLSVVMVGAVVYSIAAGFNTKLKPLLGPSLEEQPGSKHDQLTMSESR
jgi:hypothetical protein